MARVHFKECPWLFFRSLPLCKVTFKLTFWLVPWFPWFSRACGLAHRPGKPVQGFYLNKLLKSILVLNLAGSAHWGCGRGIDPYLVGYSLLQPQEREFLHATSSTSFLDPGMALRKPRGLDIVFELILNVLPLLNHFIVLYTMLD